MRRPARVPSQTIFLGRVARSIKVLLDFLFLCECACVSVCVVFGCSVVGVCVCLCVSFAPTENWPSAKAANKRSLSPLPPLQKLQAGNIPLGSFSKSTEHLDFFFLPT